MAHSWTKDVQDYWFDDLGATQWFSPTPKIDAEIRQRFEPLWGSLRGNEAATLILSPHDALAAIILFDQFPRNMFRGAADAFATDALALEIAKLSCEAGFDRDMPDDHRHFLYMPYMHSENLADQEESVELFKQIGNEKALKFAVEHRDIILRFGRFPHRNEVLGRNSRAEETQAIAQGKNW